MGVCNTRQSTGNHQERLHPISQSVWEERSLPSHTGICKCRCPNHVEQSSPHLLQYFFHYLTWAIKNSPNFYFRLSWIQFLSPITTVISKRWLPGWERHSCGCKTCKKLRGVTFQGDRERIHNREFSKKREVKDLYSGKFQANSFPIGYEKNTICISLSLPLQCGVVTVLYLSFLFDLLENRNWALHFIPLDLCAQSEFINRKIGSRG